MWHSDRWGSTSGYAFTRLGARAILIGAMCATAANAHADVVHIPAATARMEFELPRLDGREFVRLADYRGRMVLINFWDTACPPCVREMPALEQFAKAHPEVAALGITFSPRQEAVNFLAAQRVSLLQAQAPKDPQNLLRRFGNPTGALPYTVILRPDHHICARRLGEVNAQWLENMLQHCAALAQERDER